MNAGKKGNRLEGQCARQLHNDGYKTARVIRTRWASSDFFGLFDVLAVNDWHVLGVQVKANRCSKDTFRNIASFAWKAPAGFTCQIWVHKDREGWTRHAYDRGINQWVRVL